ncbi:hypothetical protein J2800_000822 [Caulobacter rhizosphaerae]|jgi:hypothetical protein|uniref:DUF1871 family protein n=1 Tax=Caulobacter rhizosphaerae TaxID=2010972 RepID=A0ABU1MVH9_9CAUL|nr:hypothetical protein [Caulobacter rhizosphaerae]MDR6530098.1 hypothetical protein [Caulobacter rhizosphaerae]
MSIDRKVVRQRIERIRQVLFADWDPLQVGSNPNLSDEYDSYLPKVMAAIDTGGAEGIVDTLVQIEDDLGVDPVDDRTALLSIARRLLELRFP